MSLPHKDHSRWLVLLAAALVGGALPPVVALLFQGGAALRSPAVGTLSGLLGVGLAALTWFCQERCRRRAAALARDRVAALPLLARIINSSLDLGEVYHAFISQLARFVPIDRASVSLVGEQGEQFQILILSSPQRTELEQGRYYPMEGSRVAWMLNHNRPETVDDIAGAGFWDWQALAEEGIRSVADIPLREPAAAKTGSASRTMGVFSLGSLRPAAYRREDLEFLAAVAEHLACAVANCRSSEEAKGRIRWLEMMHDLEDALGRTLEVEDMLRIVSDHAVRAMRADRALVALPEEIDLGREIHSEAHWRLAGPGIRPQPARHTLADFGPLVNIAVDRKAPMLSHLVAEESIAGTPLEPFYYSEGIRSLAVMPIVLEGDLLGVLLVGWRLEGAVSQENLQMFQDLASHLGVALRNARLAAALKTTQANR